MLRLSAPLLALALLGCRQPLTVTECESLLQRYTELLVRSDRADASEAELQRLKAAALSRARGEAAFRQCPKAVSRRAYDCAMAADHVDRMEQCLL
jgi:hypothetical protein